MVYYFVPWIFDLKTRKLEVWCVYFEYIYSLWAYFMQAHGPLTHSFEQIEPNTMARPASPSKISHGARNRETTESTCPRAKTRWRFRLRPHHEPHHSRPAHLKHLVNVPQPSHLPRLLLPFRLWPGLITNLSSLSLSLSNSELSFFLPWIFHIASESPWWRRPTVYSYLHFWSPFLYPHCGSAIILRSGWDFERGCEPGFRRASDHAFGSRRAAP